MADLQDNPSGWIILVLGAGTLLVVCASRKEGGSTLLATIGLLGMVGGAFGAAWDHTFLPVALIAGIACLAILFSSIKTPVADQSANSTRLMLAAASGTLALVMVIMGMRSTHPEEQPLVVFDTESARGEQRARLEIARLDLELLLQRDLPADEIAARENRAWRALEMLARRRERATRLLEELTMAVDALDAEGSTPLDRTMLESLISRARELQDTVVPGT